ncbi:MAG: hypothetical protein KatS3mg035_1344 [Bacteroidia bacterium]|nr:MAG: hypothetical protein KatS3mg035_1344 [Bacteroidia bacterium]
MNLNLFNTANLFEASTHLFEQLGIKLNSHTAEALPAKDLLKSFYKENDVFHSIKSTYFIGIIDDSIFQDSLTENQYSIHNAIEQGNKNYNGLMFFALELSRYLTRTEISELTRAFNRISQKMPIALLLKYPPISPMNEPLTSLLKDLNTPPLKEKKLIFYLNSHQRTL